MWYSEMEKKDPRPGTDVPAQIPALPLHGWETLGLILSPRAQTLGVEHPGLLSWLQILAEF